MRKDRWEREAGVRGKGRERNGKKGRMRERGYDEEGERGREKK
jgi:hypothetical protein